MEESKVIEEILKGNTDKFSVLVEKYKDMVYSLCSRMLFSTEIAEETAQDAFIKAFKYLKNYKGDSKFSTWLYRITYNCCLDVIKKEKRNLSFDTLENVIVDDKNEDFESENYDLIKVALKKLDSKDRALVQMVYLDEMSLKEIEKVTEMSISNIKVKLHRVRKNY